MAKSRTFEPMSKIKKPQGGNSASETTMQKNSTGKPVWYILSFILIIISVWIVYHDTLDHSFHFDDTHVIMVNKSIRDFSTFKDPSYWLNPNNRALSYFTFALSYSSGELSPRPYHITNILIHIASSILVFLLIIKVFKTQVMRKRLIASYAIPVALIVALIFALHPVQTQSVTYIVQRMTALSGMFFLAGIVLYLHGRQLHTDGKSPGRYATYYALTFLAWMAALMSKQEAAAMPIVLLAAEYIFIRDKDNRLYKTYLLTGTGIMALIATVVVFSGLIVPEKDALPPAAYFATQMKVILKYMQLSILPFNLTLDYAFPKSNSFFDPAALISMLVHIAVFAIAFSLRKRNPLIAFGILMFYLPLALTSTIFPIRDVIFEHRMYLSLVGFGLVITTLFFNLYSRKLNKSLYLLPFLYLLIIGYSSYERNKVWKDSCTLWEDTLKKSKDNSRAWLAVGDCYKQKQDFGTAMEYYNKSLELDSASTTALNNRGNLKLTLGDFEGAISDYNQVIRNHPEARNFALLNRGIAYIRMGEQLKALNDFTTIIDNGNAEGRVYFHRALTYVYIGEYAAAEADLLVVLEENPADQDALFNIASIMMNTDRLGEAVNYYSQLLTYNPGHVTSLHYRGVAYHTLGRKAEACNDWQQSANRNYEPSIQALQNYCTQITL